MQASSKNKILFVIAGPTAVGKTGTAIQLAKDLNCDIISADSRQVYKELSIGTAKPSADEMQGVKHHFINHISIQQHYSAGMFEREVLSFLELYFQHHDYIIMCGGTGMYIDAVCEGMDEFEEIDSALREKINAAYNQNGLQWLQQQVREKDPEYFDEVDQQNPARLIRALEIIESTGTKFSAKRKGTIKERPFRTIKILLNTNREKLYERINKRVDDMMNAGLLKEAESVFPFRSNKALNTVGYKELFAYFDKQCSLQASVDQIKQNSRRYAKRQLTWFNNRGNYHIFDPENYSGILQFIRQELSAAG